MNNPTLFKLNGEPVQSAYERCYEVWKGIAKDHNVEVATIAPAQGKGADYFEATPLTEKENEDGTSRIY